MNARIQEILVKYEHRGGEKRALPKILKLIERVRGDGIGASEQKQQEEIDQFKGADGLGFVNKKVLMQFKIDMMIKDLVDAKIREQKDLRRKRRKGNKKRGAQNTSAVNSEFADSPPITEGEGANDEEEESQQNQDSDEIIIEMQKIDVAEEGIEPQRDSLNPVSVDSNSIKSIEDHQIPKVNEQDENIESKTHQIGDEGQDKKDFNRCIKESIDKQK